MVFVIRSRGVGTHAEIWLLTESNKVTGLYCKSLHFESSQLSMDVTDKENNLTKGACAQVMDRHWDVNRGRWQVEQHVHPMHADEEKYFPLESHRQVLSTWESLSRGKHLRATMSLLISFLRTEMEFPSWVLLGSAPFESCLLRTVKNKWLCAWEAVHRQRCTRRRKTKF